MQIYALSNIDDLSWGNRPANPGEEKKKEDPKKKYRIFKAKYTISLIFFNILYCLIIEAILKESEGDIKDVDGSWGFVEILAIIFGIVAIVKVLFAFLHIISFKCCCTMNKTGYTKRKWSDIKNPQYKEVYSKSSVGGFKASKVVDLDHMDTKKDGQLEEIKEGDKEED